MKAKLKQWFHEWWLLLLPATFALGAITVYTVVFRSMPATENPAAWGTFGDFIGGLMNPLVSVLTLFVAISVWKLQKAELELTRNEMAQTKEAMEDQAKTAEQQRREQRFFDLLKIYTDALNAIGFTEKFEETRVHHVGKHAFRFLISSYKSPLAAVIHAFEKPSQWGSYLTPPTEPSNLVEEWRKVSPLLDHYFRTTSLVLNELELLFEEERERRRYGTLLLTQLSGDEVFLIAMNLIYSETGDEMKDVVIKFGLLKHMPTSYLRTVAEGQLHARAFDNEWSKSISNPSTT